MITRTTGQPLKSLRNLGTEFVTFVESLAAFREIILNFLNFFIIISHDLSHFCGGSHCSHVYRACIELVHLSLSFLHLTANF